MVMLLILWFGLICTVLPFSPAPNQAIKLLSCSLSQNDLTHLVDLVQLSDLM